MAFTHNIVNSSENNIEYRNLVFLISFIAAMGGLLFGLDQGFIANSLSTLQGYYHLSIHQSEHFAGVIATGGVFGALVSGIMARFLGRKKSLIIAGAIFSLMSLLSTTLPSFEVLTFCRFGLGFAVGISSFIVPLYLSETAPPNIRGSMGSLFQIMLCVGIFLIAVTNETILFFESNPKLALPLMFSVIALFSLLMFLGAIILPESPRWLMIKNKKKSAQRVLSKILVHKRDIDNEIKEIEEVVDAKKPFSLKSLFNRYSLKIILLGMLIQMFQQLIGINLIIYYSPRIFNYANITGVIAALIVPTVNMLFTFPAIRLVDKLGRKKLLYIGSVIMMITLSICGFIFYNIANLPANAPISEINKILLIIAVVVYIFGFEISWGPIAWVLCSELFPLQIREIGVTITTMVNWTFAGIVASLSLSFMQNFGNFSIFFVFAGFCLVSMFFLKLFVPETRMVSLEHIEINLKNGLPLRDIGK